MSNLMEAEGLLKHKTWNGAIASRYNGNMV